MLIYKVGDATAPEETGQGPVVIAHVVNNVGGWGAGFVVALSRRWKAPEAEYRRWHRDGFFRSKRGNILFELGQIQVVQVEPGLFVANLVAQHGYGPDAEGHPPFRPGAFDACLITLGDFAEQQQCQVVAPRLGAGLAGGDWNVISLLLRSRLIARGIPVTIYDLPDQIFNQEQV